MWIRRCILIFKNTHFYATITPPTHILTNLQPHVKNHTKSKQFLTVFFRFSMHFIFLTVWWLLFCKKLMEPRGRSLSSVNYIYIYISNIYLFIIGHCWRSRDELISDVLLWTPTYGRANIYSAAMWGYGMWPWRPTRSNER